MIEPVNQPWRTADAAALADGDEEVDLFPVSPAQRRLWFLDRLGAAGSAYNLALALKLAGPLDVALLARALAALAARHEALRTSIVTLADSDGEPLQLIAPPVPPALPVVDLSALSGPARAAEVERAAAARLAAPFDLAAGPLLRLALLRRQPCDHVLVAVVHHIVADGRSLDLFVRELAALYGSARTGTACPLPPPPCQPADLADGPARQSGAGALDRQLRWWTERLAGAPSLLALPADRRRPAEPAGRGATVRRRFPAALSRRLEELGRRRGATPFATHLGAVFALLHRWSGLSDLVVGAPVDQRHRPELAGVFGFLVDTVLLRADLAGRPSFRSLVDRARDTVLGALAHQEVPLERIVEALGVERRLDHQPFLQVLFGLEDGDAGKAALTAGDLQLQRLDLAVDAPAKADLSLVLERGREGLGVWLRYAADLFERDTLLRLLDAYEALLAGAATDPERPLDSLPLLTAGQRHQLLIEWNATAAAFEEGPVHETFARRAAESPDAIAATDGEVWLSYRELGDRAARQARALIRRGLAREACVGLCLPPSLDLIVAQLAVLAAGGAYVPLDPGLPAARLATLIGEVGMPLVLSSPAGRAVLPRQAAPIVGLDELARSAPPAGAGCLLPGGSPADLAAIMFTSGSTGRPKGVAVPHRAIGRLVRQSNYLRLRPGDRVAMAANPGFDASFLEIWGPLLNGATLVLVPRDLLFSPGAFFDFLAAERITVLWLTKTLFDQMARHDPRGFAPLDVLLVGGEALDPDLVRAVLASGRGPRLRNGYGPTENTTFTAVHAVTSVPPRALGVPIGAPIANTRVYVLDAALEPVPVGVAGELYAAGAGLARGYLGRPDLTAERFRPAPFAAEPGERVYRTGDLVRWRPDGTLDFLGRADQQVKIRGFRIEPAEIEAVLADHPDVAAAVVRVREEGGSRRLAAWVVPAAGRTVAAAELRGFARGRLPEYMVPSAVVALPALPVNASGKLDAAALPAPGVLAATDFAAPRTPAERALAAVFREVLGLAAVGVHDNFFEIGGDSILCIRAVARAQQQGLPLTARLVFAEQTITRLAAALGAAEGPPPAAADLPLSPVRRWFLEECSGSADGAGHFLVVQLQGAVDPRRLAAALDRLCRRQTALCLRFERGAHGWRQQVALPADSPLLVERRIAVRSTAAAERVLLAQAQALAGDLRPAAGPLLRAALLSGPGHRLVWLVLAWHPLAADGRGGLPLLADLERHYWRLGKDDEGDETLPPLLPMTLQRSSGAIARQAGRPSAEWAATASPAADRRAVRLASPDLVRQLGPRGRRVDYAFSLELTGEQTAALCAVPERSRITVPELLIAALTRALTRPAGGPLWLDVLETDPPDLARDPAAAGWLAAFYRVRCELDPDAAPGADLRAVKEEVRAARQQWAEGPPPDRAEPPASLPEILVSFAGTIDELPAGSRLFAAARAGRQPGSGGGRADHHHLGIVAAVAEGRLTVEWTYDTALFHPVVVQRLILDHGREIQALVEHCLAGGGAGATPSDFPLAALGQDALDRLLGRHPAAGDIADLYPLTPLQESMVVHTLVQPRSRINFEQMSFLLRGRLDHDAFRRAWELAVARHPILRTTFVWEGLARPLQAVRRTLPLSFAAEDWDGLPEAEWRRRLALHLEQDRERGFDLAAGPLFRLALLRLAGDRHCAVLSFHHALLDGWSLEQLDREVAQSYRALCAGRQPDLPACPPYRRYVEWLGEQDPALAQGWYRRLLGSFAAPTPLPAGAAAAGGERRLVLAAEESAALCRFARRHGLTLGTLHLGAWALLLVGGCEDGGRNDVVFGATVAGRPAELPGVEAMLGLFIHNLPVRVRLDGDRPVAAWLRDLQAQQAESARLAPVPPHALQGWSAVPPGRRLFETLVVVENLPAGEAAWTEGEELAIERVASRLETAYPLTLVVIPGERIELRLVDRAGCGEEARGRLLDGLRRCLLGLAGDRDRGLAALVSTTRMEHAGAVLPAPEGCSGTAAPPFVAPRDTLEIELARLVEELLGFAPVSVTRNLFELGAASLLAVQLVERIAATYGQRLAFSDLFADPTVAGLAALLSGAARPGGWSPLIPLESRGKRPNFFCVHPIAGNAAAFLDLARLTGADQPFFALQAPGVEGEQAPLERVEDLADLYVAAVRRRQPAGPYYLGGYSFGGVVAFEMAHRMTAEGDAVALLAILDTPAPVSPPETVAEDDDLAWLLRMVRVRERFFGVDLALIAADLAGLDAEARLRLVLERQRAAGLLPRAADLELLRRLVAVSRAQYRAYRSYRPAGPWAGPIILLRSTALGPEGRESGFRRAFDDPALLWGALSDRPVAVLRVPGDHVTMMAQPQVGTLAAALRDAIDRAQAASSGDERWR